MNESKGPCSGDSGSGFYLRNELAKVFELKGIVSASLSELSHGCDIEVYSLYTDVAKFVDWIRMEMKKLPMKTVWEDVEFDCIEDDR